MSIEPHNLCDCFEKIVQEKDVTRFNPEKNCLCLNDQTNTKGTDVIIRNVPEDILAINIDSYGLPTGFFRTDQVKFLTMKADYLLVTSEGRCVVHLELKEANPDDNKIPRQLRGCKVIYEHSLSIIRTHITDEDSFQGLKNVYAAIAFRGSEPKSPTPIRRNSRIPEGEGDKPDSFLKLKGSDIDFRRFFIEHNPQESQR